MDSDTFGASPSGPSINPRLMSLSNTCVQEAGVDGADLSVHAAPGAQVTLYATDDVALALEEMQFTLGEGPCIDASATGAPVLIGDLADPTEGVSRRWAMFVEEATKAGARAVFAFPIRFGAVALGTLDLYRRTPGDLGDRQLDQALSGVDAIGQCLLDMDAPPPEDGDLPYPMAVHQAAGMVMVQLGTTIDEALVRLRAAAYAEGTPIGALAADVVAGRRRLHKEER